MTSPSKNPTSWIEEQKRLSRQIDKVIISRTLIPLGENWLESVRCQNLHAARHIEKALEILRDDADRVER